ncbi:MAG TPA: toxin-antitoxin system HicB family antitoxin [Acidimicrobiales bacterium]|nr:toxin-antitoxin system HicB family antitoxin [Acidimicrobiales bacterium]
MLISHYVEGIRSDLASLGRLGAPELEEFASRLADAAGPALRTRLLEAIDGLIAEANAESDRRDLSLGLAGDEVTVVRAGTSPDGVDAPGEFTARFALRLPDELKAQIEQQAQQMGVSANSWIVRALARESAQGVMRGAKVTGRQLRGSGRS